MIDLLSVGFRSCLKNWLCHVHVQVALRSTDGEPQRQIYSPLSRKVPKGTCCRFWVSLVCSLTGLIVWCTVVLWSFLVWAGSILNFKFIVQMQKRPLPWIFFWMDFLLTSLLRYFIVYWSVHLGTLSLQERQFLLYPLCIMLIEHLMYCCLLHHILQKGKFPPLATEVMELQLLPYDRNAGDFLRVCCVEPASHSMFFDMWMSLIKAKIKICLTLCSALFLLMGLWNSGICGMGPGNWWRLDS